MKSRTRRSPGSSGLIGIFPSPRLACKNTRKESGLTDFGDHEAAKLYDPDILFNPPVWNELVETQCGLFRPAALHQISDRLRHEFHFGHAAGRQMPEIAATDWSTCLLAPYSNGPIGYDLPCLLSAARPAQGKIMLCAQDPLRGPGPAKLTVGTFFGIDSNYHRTRRHWGMIWQLIRACIQRGYDVWVTDAIKVFAGPNVVNRDEGLRELCFGTVREEVAAFRPDRVIAFGAVAENAISAASIKAPILRVPHPTARGIRGTLGARLEEYSRLIFE